ncbi:hypothetical protein KW787_03580 [Candidatus Pacearchaeota archaeon]|nr:hypothetical protein [Candidatus Pacearchaeota archaeon]
MPEDESFKYLFLEEYVRYLIFHSKKPMPPNSQEPALVLSSQIPILVHPQAPLPHQKDSYQPSMTAFPQPAPIRRPIPRPMPRPQMMMPKRIPEPAHVVQPPQLPPPVPAYHPSPEIHAPEALGLTKLSTLISDPAVAMIECAGPDKQIIVTKGGVLQTTMTKLNNEEINEIMKEVSEKTKIPIIPGIFKAALDNIIVTAVVSEFVGTRFVIQKRGPSR